MVSRENAFDGRTYDPDRDFDRLNAQLQRVYKIVHDGAWHTLRAIAVETGDPEASVSARLRDLRKPKYGSQLIERRFVRKGLWEYRLVKD